MPRVALRMLVLLLAVVAASMARGDTAPAARWRPHVYLVVVDGLDPRAVSPETMPVLGASGRAPGRALAVMPTRTNPSHVSLLTGTWPEDHGITGNAYWSRRPEDGIEKTDDPALIDVETLFTVAEREQPALVTIGVFGKPKLGRLFAEVAGRQHAPDTLWSPERDGPGVDPVTHYADDATTMARLLALIATTEPDLVVVNLADVDRQSHAFGPASAEARAAVVGANAAIARLVDALHAAGRWDRSLVVVTADHGFDDVRARPGGPEPVIDLTAAFARLGVHGVRVARDGGLAHVYAEGVAAGAIAPGTSAGTLAKAATVARSLPGVADVVARLPVPGVPLLAERHPGWHLAHQRAGELLVIAQPGYQFLDADDVRLAGNHGGPGEQRVPFAVLGGHPAAAVLAAERDVTLPDVGATAASLLGLDPGRRFDGAPLRAPGRVLIEAR